MPDVFPFPGNPNVTGSNMPPGLAMPPPRSGGPGAQAGSALGPNGAVAQVVAPAGAPTPRQQLFATPPGTPAAQAPQQAVQSVLAQIQAANAGTGMAAPPGAGPKILSADQMAQSVAAASMGMAVPPGMTVGGPAWHAGATLGGLGDGGTSSTGPAPQAPQPPAPPAGTNPLAAAPWYWRLPIGAYVMASRLPWWVWLGVGVAGGVAATHYIQRRRRRVIRRNPLGQFVKRAVGSENADEGDHGGIRTVHDVDDD